LALVGHSAGCRLSAGAIYLYIAYVTIVRLPVCEGFCAAA